MNKYLILIICIVSFFVSATIKNYYTHTQKTISDLEKSVQVYKSDNEKLKGLIKNQNNNINSILLDISNQQKKINELYSEQKTINESFNKLKKKNDERDYQKLLEKKPELTLKIINNSIKKYNKNLTNLSKKMGE